jgi:hypothetical protein
MRLETLTFLLALLRSFTARSTFRGVLAFSGGCRDSWLVNPECSCQKRYFVIRSPCHVQCAMCNVADPRGLLPGAPRSGCLPTALPFRWPEQFSSIFPCVRAMESFAGR